MESCQWSTAVAWILILTTATVRQCIANDGVVSVCADLCTCTNQNFATVNCTFDSSTTNQRNAGPTSRITSGNRFVLDGKLFIPSSATALNIKLIAGGQLAIHKDFFKQNNINHLFIDGSKSRTDAFDIAVEFHDGALCNNNGQFPEILITNVARLVMHKHVSCGAHLLNITDVKDVVLKTEFLSVDGAEIYINNVNNLHIEKSAFGNSTSSKVQIHRTTIGSLPKLGVSFRLLSFNECNISEIMPHAFQANEIEHIEFINCNLTNLRQKAFTSWLLSDSLIFRGCYIRSIESQFMDGSGMKMLMLDRNKIDEIATSAFSFTSISTFVTDNHVIRTGREWLHPKDWENVTISGNSFGDFNGIVLNDRKKDDTVAYCFFGNNTITKALPDCFTFGQFCLIDAVHFGRECDCSYDEWLNQLFGNVRPESSTMKTIVSSASCQVEESLRYCFNRSDAPLNDTTSTTTGQVNVQFFLSEFCQKGGSKKCSSYASAEETHRKPPPLIPVEKIGSLDEANGDGFWSNSMTWISIVAVCIAAILLLSLTVCIYRRKTHAARETITNQPSSRQGTPLRRSTSHTRHPFTTADRRVIGSALHWIRESYGQKVWTEIDTPMQQLLTPSQSGGLVEEQAKVRLIGSILDSLKRHEICGERIVALNDILFRQLGPPVPELVEAAQPDGDANGEMGHIYDELQPNRTRTFGGNAVAAPQHVGLLGEYAAPLDHGGVTVVPEGIYSEPVLHDQQLLQRNAGNRNLISPYAIGDATVQRNPAGHEAGNLPDVILLRPGTNTWKPGNVEEELDDDDEDEGGDGEAERKTMLRPADCVDGSSTGPTYAISTKQLKRPHRGNNTTPPLPSGTGVADEQPDATDGNRSEHSGSSMQTVRIEDMTVEDGNSDQRL